MQQNLVDSDIKTVAIFDLDHTITSKDTYLAFLIQLLREHPMRVFACVKLPFAWLMFKLGYRSNSWLKEAFLQAIAGGLSRKQIVTSRNRFIHQLLNRGIRPGAFEAIKQHQQQNHYLVMATASFDFYVQELAHNLGFNHVICTPSCWDEQDQLVGKIAGQNCYGDVKLKRLEEHFGEIRHQVHLIGYSDHHTDDPFLQWVDQAVAVNPTEKLRKIAIHKQYVIEDWEVGIVA